MDATPNMYLWLSNMSTHLHYDCKESGSRQVKFLKPICECDDCQDRRLLGQGSSPCRRGNTHAAQPVACSACCVITVGLRWVRMAALPSISTDFSTQKYIWFFCHIIVDGEIFKNFSYELEKTTYVDLLSDVQSGQEYSCWQLVNWSVLLTESLEFVENGWEHGVWHNIVFSATRWHHAICNTENLSTDLNFLPCFSSKSVFSLSKSKGGMSSPARPFALGFPRRTLVLSGSGKPYGGCPMLP